MEEYQDRTGQERKPHTSLSCILPAVSMSTTSKSLSLADESDEQDAQKGEEADNKSAYHM